MRFAVVSDVHGNLPALEVVLATADRLGVDAVYSTGDLVGYGPWPNECVRTVAAVAAASIAGNHDLIAIDRLTDDRCIPLAQRSLAWTRRVLEDDARATLARLPLISRPTPSLLLAHGTPTDPQAYVDRVEDAQLVLSDVAASEPDVRMVIVGHTHRWMAYGERAGALPTHPGASLELDGDARVLLNAGSVGQSRQRTARARFIVVDLAAGTVTFDEVRYDVAAARRALRRVGLSPRGVHLYSSPPRRAVARFLRD